MLVDNPPQQDSQSPHEERQLPSWFRAVHRGRQTPTVLSSIPQSLSPLLPPSVHSHEFPVFLLLLQGMASGRVKHPNLPWAAVWEAHLLVSGTMALTFVLSLCPMAPRQIEVGDIMPLPWVLPCVKGARHTPSCGCGGLLSSNTVCTVPKDVSETPSPSCNLPIPLPHLPALAAPQQPSCRVPPQKWEARGMIPGVIERPY